MSKRRFYILTAVLVLLTIAFTSKVFASLTFTTSAITGTASSTIDLGSGHDLYLQTNSGNVGIGTTSPTKKLDVNGTINTSDIITKGPVIDVRAYGAKGDGVTDDTAAIQSAMNTATPGSIIFFPPATYAITGSLLVQKSLTLLGSGSDTVIKYKNGITLPDGANYPLILIKPGSVSFSDVVVTQLTLNGNRDNTTQFNEGNAGVAIYTNDPYSVNHVWVTYVHTENTRGDGVLIQATTPFTILPTDIFIINNLIEDWQDIRQGVAIVGGSRITVSGNHFFNHAGVAGQAFDVETNGQGVGEKVTNVDFNDNIIGPDVGNGYNVQTNSPSVVTGISIHDNLIRVTGTVRSVQAGAGVGVIEYGNTVADGSVYTMSNVGIGTTSPGAKLDVQGAGNTQLLNFTTSSAGTGYTYGSWTNTGGSLRMGISNLVGNGIFTGDTAYATVFGSNNATPLQFATNGTVNMTILSGGNVGIGTTNPSFPLDVVGDINSSTVIRLGGGLTFSATAPTIASGFGTVKTVEAGSTTASWTVTVTTSGGATTGTLTLPAAAHRWTCWATDQTTNAKTTFQSGGSTTTAVFTATAAWVDGDIIVGGCSAH